MHRVQQAIKWTVYTLLIVYFGFYIAEDWNRAMHSLDAGATLFEWTTEFATSIDELGWFLLLAMFELESAPAVTGVDDLCELAAAIRRKALPRGRFR